MNTIVFLYWLEQLLANLCVINSTGNNDSIVLTVFRLISYFLVFSIVDFELMNKLIKRGGGDDTLNERSNVTKDAVKTVM